MTTAVRENLCQMGRMEIPRPEFKGMQFVATRGKMGFYRTIRANGAQYGLQVKQLPPRRPALSNALFERPDTVKEEDSHSEGTLSPPMNRNSRSVDRQIHSDNDDSSSQMSNYSVSPQPPSPVDLPPDYPEDYVPQHLRSSHSQVDKRFTKRF